MKRTYPPIPPPGTHSEILHHRGRTSLLTFVVAMAATMSWTNAQAQEQDFGQYVHRYESLEVQGVQDPFAELTPVELGDYYNEEVEITLTEIETVDKVVESYSVNAVLGTNNASRPTRDRGQGCVVTLAGTKCYTVAGQMIVNSPPFPEDVELFSELGAFISNSPGSGLLPRASSALEIGKWPYAKDTVELYNDSTGLLELVLIKSPLQVIEYLSDTSMRHTRYQYDQFLRRTTPAREELVRHITTYYGLPAVRRTVAVFGQYFDPKVKMADFDRFEGLVHPNPAHNEIFLQAAAGVDVARVEVRDMLGSIHKVGKLVNNRIDVSGFPAGAYLVTFVSKDDQSYTSQFAKL